MISQQGGGGLYNLLNAITAVFELIFRHCWVPEALHYWVTFKFIVIAGLTRNRIKSGLLNNQKAGLLRCNAPRNDSKTRASCRVGKALAFPPQNNAAFTLAEGASHGAVSDSHRKAAFTLAEVLITLGIIGVVAALTLPTLIAKYEKKVIATRAKQTYSQLYQAIQLSTVDNGEPKYWDINSGGWTFENTERFLNKYMLPYLNSPKFCANGKSDEAKAKCGAASFSVSQTYTLPNGVAISILPHSSSIVMNIEIDVNGPKQPNRAGYDQFQFYLLGENGKLSFIREINGFTREDILAGKQTTIDGRTNYVACKKSQTDERDIYYRSGCTALLMMDGWEIKDDYPW